MSLGLEDVLQAPICTPVQRHHSSISFISISRWLCRNYGLGLFHRTWWFFWFFLTFTVHQWRHGEVLLIVFCENPDRSHVYMFYSNFPLVYRQVNESSIQKVNVLLFVSVLLYCLSLETVNAVEYKNYKKIHQGRNLNRLLKVVFYNIESLKS